MSMASPQNFLPYEAAIVHGLLSARLRGKSNHEYKLSLGFKGLPETISLQSRLRVYQSEPELHLEGKFLWRRRAGALSLCFVSPVGAERVEMF